MNAHEATNITEARSRTWTTWISQKHFNISRVSFGGLIAYNLLVARANVIDPFDFQHPQALLATILILSGLLIRSWSASLLRKVEVLVTSGPYALVRNPLYVGSFLMMFGFCLLMQDWITFAFVAGPMAFIYWFQVKSEEARLSKLFGIQWTNYVHSTGRFIPRSINQSVFMKCSLSQWMRNREYEALSASLCALLVLHWFYPAVPSI